LIRYRVHFSSFSFFRFQADRIGSGRFRQPQGQRKREERTQRTETMNRNAEFHLDVPPMGMWTNNTPIVPVHVQLLPPNLNGPVEHHLINSHNEQTIPNFLYPTATPHTPFNSNGTIYFTSRPTGPPSAPAAPQAPTHFPSFQQANRTFENSTFHHHHHHPFHPLSPFPSGNVFQPAHFLAPGNLHPYGEENPSIPNHFRPLRITPDRELKKPNHRPQQQQQRNQTTSLPLSAYMNTDDNEYSSNQKRRTTRTSQHQFPLSSYDPRQYGFHRRTNQRRPTTKNVDLIEEWWEDDNAELIGTTVKTNDDSGHSSLSTSTNYIQESSHCENQQSKLNDSTQSSTDSSTSDKQILHSLDRLQQELKFEETIDECLTSEQVDSIKQSGTYNTAHFLQWAKKMFREELAGRLTAQEIQHHDAVTRDDDEQPLGDKLDALRDDLEEKLNIENDVKSSTNE